MNMKKLISMAALPFLLAACAGGDSGVDKYDFDNNFAMEESLGGTYTDTSNNAPYMTAAAPKYYIGAPYKIDGVQYTPSEDMFYNQTGMAGIIPADLNGAQTTNGEIFNTNQMLATSKTLPLPSIVRVTNLENGEFVTVRVNNRGPFVNTRIMDLSPAAAKKLGMTGPTKVQVQILAEQSTMVKNATLGTASSVSAVEQPAAVSAAGGTGPYTVQIAAFYSEDSANSLAQRVSYIRPATIVQESGMFKVRMNNLDAAAARGAIDSLRNSEAMSPGLLKDGRWINADSI